MEREPEEENGTPLLLPSLLFLLLSFLLLLLLLLLLLFVLLLVVLFVLGLLLLLRNPAIDGAALAEMGVTFSVVRFSRSSLACSLAAELRDKLLANDPAVRSCCPDASE